MKTAPDIADAPLPQALLELIRRLAVAQSWGWSTVGKALSTTLAALTVYSRCSRCFSVFVTLALLRFVCRLLLLSSQASG
jgi:hypothetical protein